MDGPDAVQMASRVGMRMPLHTTAIGKCVLPGLPAADLASVVAAELPARTSNSLTTAEALRKELQRVR
ncbi:MAG TPA: IclR family transcriptional regulator C-terminal domain-containing protein, partial [Pseudonocardiaceae bacterium]|nr:IclR family transcriptional regulator C-terminal domain-containing protein [Pseudonocardiaceae bacterium]